MVRSFVLRGIAVGALAGLLAFVFGRIFAEPVIQAAIDYEGARDDAQKVLDAAAGLPAGADGPDLVSRAVQSSAGIALGMILFGIAMGALFAVVYTLLWGRLGQDTRPRTQAVLLAAAGFTVLYLVPFLRYPANPPAVGHEDTIGPRTGLYLIMVVGSVVAALVALYVRQRLAAGRGTWNATLAGLAVYVVLAGLLIAVLPPLGHLQLNIEQYGDLTSETPQPLRNPAGAIVFPGFDADLLYQFRLYSVLAQGLLWAVIGLGFGALTERALGRTPAAAEHSPA
jgi:hypothetical protein